MAINSPVPKVSACVLPEPAPNICHSSSQVHVDISSRTSVHVISSSVTPSIGTFDTATLSTEQSLDNTESACALLPDQTVRVHHDHHYPVIDSTVYAGIVQHDPVSQSSILEDTPPSHQSNHGSKTDTEHIPTRSHTCFPELKFHSYFAEQMHASKFQRKLDEFNDASLSIHSSVLHLKSGLRQTRTRLARRTSSHSSTSGPFKKKLWKGTRHSLGHHLNTDGHDVFTSFLCQQCTSNVFRSTPFGKCSKRLRFSTKLMHVTGRSRAQHPSHCESCHEHLIDTVFQVRGCQSCHFKGCHTSNGTENKSKRVFHDIRKYIHRVPFSPIVASLSVVEEDHRSTSPFFEPSTLHPTSTSSHFEHSTPDAILEVERKQEDSLSPTLPFIAQTSTALVEPFSMNDEDCSQSSVVTYIGATVEHDPPTNRNAWYDTLGCCTFIDILGHGSLVEPEAVQLKHSVYKHAIPVLFTPLIEQQLPIIREAIKLFTHQMVNIELTEDRKDNYCLLENLFHPICNDRWTWIVLTMNQEGICFSHVLDNKKFFVPFADTPQAIELLGHRTFTLFGCKRPEPTDTWIDIQHLLTCSHSVIFVHEELRRDMSISHADLCCGMGLLAHATQLARIDTKCVIDHNPIWQKLAEQNSQAPFYSVDIFDIELIHTLAEHNINFITAGISCQSFSRQGAEQGLRDRRGTLIVPLLLHLHMLGIRLALLECTTEVLNHMPFQHIFQTMLQFMDCRADQHVLKSNFRWCSTRERWFCHVIPNTQIGASLCFRPFGGLQRNIRHIAHLWNHIKQHEEAAQLILSEDQIQDLRNDSTQVFNTRIVQHIKFLPTILHSYGNVWLNKCPCSSPVHCRRFPFSRSNLKNKGIRGVVALCNAGTKFRFLLPSEINALTGTSRSFFTGEDTRLALAGIGQGVPTILAASPLGAIKDMLGEDTRHLVFSHQTMLQVLAEQSCLPTMAKVTVHFVMWHRSWPTHKVYIEDPATRIDDFCLEYGVLDFLSSKHILLNNMPISKSCPLALVEHSLLTTEETHAIPFDCLHSLWNLLDHTVATSDCFEQRLTRFLTQDDHINKEEGIMMVFPWHIHSHIYYVRSDLTIQDLFNYLNTCIKKVGFLSFCNHKQLPSETLLTKCTGVIRIHVGALPGGTWWNSTDQGWNYQQGDWQEEDNMWNTGRYNWHSTAEQHTWESQREAAPVASPQNASLGTYNLRYTITPFTPPQTFQPPRQPVTQANTAQPTQQTAHTSTIQHAPIYTPPDTPRQPDSIPALPQLAHVQPTPKAFPLQTANTTRPNASENNQEAPAQTTQTTSSTSDAHSPAPTVPTPTAATTTNQVPQEPSPDATLNPEVQDLLQSFGNIGARTTPATIDNPWLQTPQPRTTTGSTWQYDPWMQDVYDKTCSAAAAAPAQDKETPLQAQKTGNLPYHLHCLALFLRSQGYQPFQVKQFLVDGTNKLWNFKVANHITVQELALYLKAQFPPASYIILVSDDPSTQQWKIPPLEYLISNIKGIIGWNEIKEGEKGNPSTKDPPTRDPPQQASSSSSSSSKDHPAHLNKTQIIPTKQVRIVELTDNDIQTDLSKEALDRALAPKITREGGTTMNEDVHLINDPPFLYEDINCFDFIYQYFRTIIPSQRASEENALEEIFQEWLTKEHPGTHQVCLTLPWNYRFRVYLMHPDTTAEDIKLFINTLYRGRHANVTVNGQHIIEDLPFYTDSTYHFRITGCRGGAPKLDPLQDPDKDAWQTWHSNYNKGQHADYANKQNRRKIPRAQLIQDISDLLKIHGVAEKHLIDQAKQLVQKFGYQDIEPCFHEDNPWQHMEALAEKRGYQLLNDKTKVKPPLITITSNNDRHIPYDDLFVLTGDFENEMDSSQLKHIVEGEIIKDAEGVAVLSPVKALPFAKLKNELSQGCLGIIVPFLDEQTPVFVEPPSKTCRFGLRRKTTGEISIYTCYFIQLGKINAQRKHTPGAAPIPDDTVDIVINIHRKDVTVEWKTVVTHPVRFALDHVEHLNQEVIRITRATTQSKVPYVVLNALIKATKLEQFLKLSGRKGIFISYTQENVALNQKFRPVWLGEVTLEEALSKTSIINNTFGLIKRITKTRDGFSIHFAVRVLKDEFEETRPTLTGDTSGKPFISSRQKFIIAPVAPGTTKDDIMKLLEHTKWSVRPLVQITPTDWLVCSEEQPPTNLLSFETGDIAITQYIPRPKIQTDSMSTTSTISNRFEQLTPLPTPTQQAFDDRITSCQKNIKDLKDTISLIQHQQERQTKEAKQATQKTEEAHIQLQNKLAHLETHLHNQVGQELTKLHSSLDEKIQNIEKKHNAFEASTHTLISDLKQDIIQQMQNNQTALMESFNKVCSFRTRPSDEEEDANRKKGRSHAQI